MSDSQMQGTSIEDIEMGNVKNEADSEAMRQILTDMNVTDESTNRPQPPMQQMQSAPPDYTTHMLPPPSMPRQRQMQPFPQHYPPRMQVEEYDQEPEEPTPAPKYKKVKPIMKKNKWSELFETLKEPLLVGLLVAVLLIPKLHTLGSKYAAWAYTVGGQLGWIGILICSVIAMAVWGLYKFFTN